MGKSGREKLIESATCLFYQDGFHATGISAILKDAGVSRMTLYHHFKSKDDLALAVLREFDQDYRRFFAERSPTDRVSSKEKLLALFDTMADWLGGKTPAGEHFNGCLLTRAALEYSDPDDPIHRFANEHKWLFRKNIEEIAVTAGAIDPQGVAKDISLLAEGVYVTSMMCKNESSALDAKRIAGIIFDKSFI